MSDSAPGSLDDLRAELIAAIRDVYKVRGLGSFESRRMRRTFDPAWRRMETESRRFASELRAREFSPEAAIAEFRKALDVAISGLAPYHPIRASVIGWCADTFAGT